MKIVAVFLLSSAVFVANVRAQQAVPGNARYYRVICLVHLTGAGTHQDSKRPEFAPPETSRDGIMSWSMQTSDDGRYALVHLVAANHKALEPILNDKRSDIRVFEIGKTTKGEIEKELKKFRKDFDLDRLQVVVR